MLINCVLYRNGERVGDIPITEIRKYTAQADAFVWVALRDPEASELELLQTEFGLHELAVEDAMRGHQRPKIEEYGSSLFVVVHTIELEKEDLIQGEASIFVGPNFVLTVRRGTRTGFADVRTRSEQEPELLRHGPAYVLYALLDSVVDRYFPVVDCLSDEIEGIEEKIFSEKTSRAQIEALYGLKRKIVLLKHATGPLQEVAGKLHGGRVPALCAGLQDYFRDVYDHLTRLNQLLDDLRDTVATAMSVNLSLITISENEVTKQLASYAALVAVPTLIVGIYGMNFDVMPELRWTYGYPATILAMIAIDGYLVYRFKKAKWL